jgi:hypothetical protein
LQNPSQNEFYIIYRRKDFGKSIAKPEPESIAEHAESNAQAETDLNAPEFTNWARNGFAKATRKVLCRIHRRTYFTKSIAELYWSHHLTAQAAQITALMHDIAEPNASTATARAAPVPPPWARRPAHRSDTNITWEDQARLIWTAARSGRQLDQLDLDGSSILCGARTSGKRKHSCWAHGSAWALPLHHLNGSE